MALLSLSSDRSFKSTQMSAFIFLVVISSFSLTFEPVAGDSDPNAIFPMVTTPLGQLRVQMSRSRAGRWYYAFKGIPYAHPPARFEPSEMWTTSWEESGVRDATSFGPSCPHNNGSMGFMGDESCLYLNVYFPHHDRCQDEAEESGGLPVIVFLHGGSYTNGGSSIFGMNYFMDECVVVVTPNYRQGALARIFQSMSTGHATNVMSGVEMLQRLPSENGIDYWLCDETRFLTTDDGVIPGNLGLKDQKVALQWVQNYIEAFRGNPNLVTLMGCSSGSSAVSHHIASPASRDLFHRAILQSGTIMSPWSIVEKPELEAQILAGKLGCSQTQNNSTALKSCLESADVRDIVTNQMSSPYQPAPYAPVIELSTSENTFQTQHPAQRLINGDFNRVPIIAGFVESEYLLEDPVAIGMLNTMWSQVLPNLFMFDQLGLSEAEKLRISTEIREFYFGNETIGPKTRANLTALCSDRFFVQPTFETAELHSKFANVFPYILTYKGGDSRAWRQNGYEIPMVNHGDEEQYLFDRSPFAFGTEQYDFSRKLIRYWTTFAKSGNPNYDSGSGESTSWLPIGETQAWHRLDLAEKSLPGFLSERRSFWKNLGLYQAEWS